jgi:hypothetical protein
MQGCRLIPNYAACFLKKLYRTPVYRFSVVSWSVADKVKVHCLNHQSPKSGVFLPVTHLEVAPFGLHISGIFFFIGNNLT